MSGERTPNSDARSSWISNVFAVNGTSTCCETPYDLISRQAILDQRDGDLLQVHHNNRTVCDTRHRAAPGAVAGGPSTSGEGRHRLIFVVYIFRCHEFIEELKRHHNEGTSWLRTCPLTGDRFKRRHHGANANPRTEDLDSPRRFRGRLCLSGGGRVSGAGRRFRPAGRGKTYTATAGLQSRLGCRTL